MADTGSERTVVSPTTARDLGLVPDASSAYSLWFGGKERRVTPATAELALLPPSGVTAEPVTWQAEMAVADDWDAWFTVLLGRRGFFDRFTVTFSGHAAALAVESLDVFDDRFGFVVAPDDTDLPPDR